MDDNRIIIDWRDPDDRSRRWADRWNYSAALYAVLHPDTEEILYLGKSDGPTSTVRKRWGAPDKHERVWRWIEAELGLFKHGFIVGEFRMPTGRRLTAKLVGDIESRLIYQIKPWANRQNTKSRGYSRPGEVLVCQGHWPLKRKTFRDE